MGVSNLWEDQITTVLSEQVTEFSVPIYFLEGVYNSMVNTSLAREYFEKIKAPKKGFYPVENSAHSLMLEEPDRVRRLLREEILGVVAK